MYKPTILGGKPKEAVEMFSYRYKEIHDDEFFSQAGVMFDWFVASLAGLGGGMGGSACSGYGIWFW